MAYSGRIKGKISLVAKGSQSIYIYRNIYILNLDVIIKDSVFKFLCVILMLYKTA